jgi:hypothetical protein
MTSNQPESSTVKLQWYEHACCGLPLLLIFLGGAVGGACGGLGYAFSTAVFKKAMPTPAKYALSLVISFAAFGAYLGIVLALALAFPNFFKH